MASFRKTSQATTAVYIPSDQLTRKIQNPNSNENVQPVETAYVHGSRDSRNNGIILMQKKYLK